MHIEDKKIKDKLLEIYPDGVVKAISSNDIYKDIKIRLKIKNLKIKEYIEELDLVYVHKTPAINEDNVIDVLLELYPEGYIPNISDIVKKQQKIYLFLNEYCNEKAIDKIDFLTDLGFQIGNAKKDDKADTSNKSILREPNSIFDTYTLNELIRSYNCNKSELARLLGTTKQNLDGRISAKRLTIPFWQHNSFNSDEIACIIHTINKREVYSEDLASGILVRIFFGNGNKSNIAILTKNNGVYKCQFEFSGEIDYELKKYGYYIFEEKDIELLRTIYAENNLCELIFSNSDLSTLKINNNALNLKLHSRAKELNLLKGQYLEFLGFKISHKNFIYDDETIKKILRSFVTKDNIVKIPIDNEYYHKMMILAPRRGFKSLPDMITSFGFEYKRIVNRKQGSKSHAEMIRERYIVYDNVIYIQSMDPFYNRIATYAYKKNIGIDDYLASLGFKRIKNPQDLPKEYEQYNWKLKEQERLKTSLEDEKVSELLDDISDEDNNIYLDTNSQIYFYLVRICNIKDIKIDHLLEMNGYKRIHKYKRVELKDSDNSNEEDNSINIVFDEEKAHIEKCLIELQSIQEDKRHCTQELEKRIRNKNLVSNLKKMYHYKCQLCSDRDDEFKTPIIEKADGTYYVEVHHIKELAEETGLEDEDINLDTYKNAIVLCCYHHKYVHYHLGGFKELVKDNKNNLYLQSKYGELRKIYTNYHLETETLIDIL